jgi:hypothetical protein
MRPCKDYKDYIAGLMTTSGTPMLEPRGRGYRPKHFVRPHEREGPWRLRYGWCVMVCLDGRISRMLPCRSLVRGSRLVAPIRQASPSVPLDSMAASSNRARVS